MFIKKKIKELLSYYNEKINTTDLATYIEPLHLNYDSSHHIYIIKIKDTNLINRDLLYKNLHKQNMKVNVHYKPIYLFTLYKNLGYKEGLCPIEEDTYKKIITLPLYYELNKNDINIILEKLLETLKKIVNISVLIKKFENVDPKLFSYLQNEFISGKEYSDLYLEDLLHDRSDSIALRNN